MSITYEDIVLSQGCEVLWGDDGEKVMLYLLKDRIYLIIDSGDEKYFIFYEDIRSGKFFFFFLLFIILNSFLW